MTNRSSRNQQDLYKSILGPRNQEYYLRQFARFDSDGNVSISWNWPAFFCTFFWLLSRKMERYAFIYFLLLPVLMLTALISTILASSAGFTAPIGTLSAVFWIYVIGAYLLPPMYANAIYHRHCRRKLVALHALTIERQNQTCEPSEKTNNDAAPLAASETPSSQRDANHKSNRVAENAETSSSPSGFRYVWIVVVFAVVGYFAYAMHATEDYHHRARIVEPILECTSLKALIEEFAIKNGKLPVNINELGVGQLQPQSKYLKSIDLMADATIVATLQGDDAFAGKAILLRPALKAGKLTWDCGAPDEDIHKYLPAECRHQLDQSSK